MSYASDALIDALERDVDRLERENGQLKYENDKLRELCGEMLKEHQRIYHAGGTLKLGPSATNKQMAHWYSECIRWGVEMV